MTRELLPIPQGINPIMRQKCGRCAHWIVGDHQAPLETMRHPKHGKCAILDCGTFYHSGGMCPDFKRKKEA